MKDILAGNEAYKQLTRCGALAYCSNVRILGPVVYADVDLEIIAWLKEDVFFLEGVGHLLHADVGGDRCDFRSIRGSFGSGSLQIVISRQTWKLYADVDGFSPYDDVVGFVGHFFGEVIPSWFKRKRSSDVDSGTGTDS